MNKIIVSKKTFYSKIEISLKTKIGVAEFNKTFRKDKDPVSFLKPKQYDAIVKIIEGNDVLCVFTTGYGKSLIYELIPFVKKSYDKETNHAAIIITPLSSIIAEKLDTYGEKGIEITENFFENNKDTDLTQIMYFLAHPEHITHKTALQTFRSMKKIIDIICVDEVHCISQWGVDFRPPFKDIVKLRSALPYAHILALTGSANKKTRREIFKSLSMDKPYLLRSSLDRPNIEIIFTRRHPSSGHGIDSAATSINYLLFPILENLVKEKRNYRKTIIYSKIKWCGHAHQTALDYIAENIPEYDSNSECQLNASQSHNECNNCKHLILVDQYHGACTPPMREKTMKNFHKGDTRIVFATEALSMGTDVRDIREIIHLMPPSTIDTYYQELGRAGRDGREAKAICYFNAHDLGLSIMSDAMKNLCLTSECRREFILDFYGSFINQENDSCCDICKPELQMNLQQITKPIIDQKKSILEQTIIDYLLAENDILQIPMHEISTIAHNVTDNMEFFLTDLEITTSYPKLAGSVAQNLSLIVQTLLNMD